jgi:hypothetical protein
VSDAGDGAPVTVTEDDEAVLPPVPDAPTRPATRRVRRRPATPAARFELGKVAEARHRNPTWIVAGVLLVLLSALGGVLLFMSSDDRTTVLVAARDLDPGRPVERADLRIERVAVDPGVATMPVAAAEGIVGEHPVGRVPAGTMLAAGMFTSAQPLGPDEVVIGAALDPGEAPMAGLQVGSAVELVRIDVPGPGATDATASATPLGAGTVWAVEPVATGQLWVSVRVTRDIGLAASVAAAEDHLRVVLGGGTG